MAYLFWTIPYPEHFNMIPKVLFISLLLVVNAQQYLTRAPHACSVPGTKPTCMYSKPTYRFKTCGIYNGGECPRFCLSLLAQYWTREGLFHRCFRYRPYLMERLFVSCLHRCRNAKTAIRLYRTAGPQKIYTTTKLSSKATRSSWSAFNIKALLYLSIERDSEDKTFVMSRVQVYTTNLPILCSRNRDGSETCGHLPKKPDKCYCANCWHYGASCPKCCKLHGYIWL